MKNGAPLQRSLSKTVVVGDVGPAYMGIVTYVSGAIMKSNLGALVGNHPGVTCQILAKENPSDPIAEGFISSVTESTCTIEIRKIFKTRTPLIEDIVQLDTKGWQADIK